MWNPVQLDAALQVAKTTNLQGRVVHVDDPKMPHGEYRASDPDMVVWHATDGDTVASAVGWLDRQLQTGEMPASFHYGIDADGKISRIVDPVYVAWHAGISSYPGLVPGIISRFSSCNARSVGIEFAIDNTPGHDLTFNQLTSGLYLAKVLVSRWPTIRYQVSHREIAPIRKTDPLLSILPMDAWRAAIFSLTSP